MGGNGYDHNGRKVSPSGSRMLKLAAARMDFDGYVHPALNRSDRYKAEMTVRQATQESIERSKKESGNDPRGED
jgi:hypothetical protein